MLFLITISVCVWFVDLGRTASHYYIKYDTIEMFNEEIKDAMDDREIFAMISKAQEFEQLKVSSIMSIYYISQKVYCRIGQL